MNPTSDSRPSPSSARRPAAAAVRAPSHRRPRATLPIATLVLAVTIAAIGACKGDSAVGPTTSAAVAGSITLSLAGLPPGAAGDVLVQGPSGFSQTVTGTTTLSALTAGTYTINAREVTASGTIYAPSPVSQSAVVGTRGTPVSVGVKYAAASGALSVAVSGLPAGTNADVTVTGPNGYSQALTGSATLPTLRVGSYTIDAAAVTVAGTVYAPAIDQPQLTVSAGATSSGTVAYAPQQQTSADLTIAGMYLVQSVQKLDRSVPLVTGKDGVLRVFVRSDQALTATPAVRVKLYLNGQLTRTMVIAAPTSSVPTATADASEGSVTSSWNVVVPGSVIAPGLSVSAQVDPFNAYGETNETDNVYPAAGPAAMAVQTAPQYRVRFVPIAQPGLAAGNVSTTNEELFLSVTRRMHPVFDIDADVGDVYTASKVVSSDNRDNSWTDLLRDLDAKRVVEKSDRSYYGVLKTSYNSGIAGLGYIGGFSAIGWEYLQTGRASEVMAHEIGHNWNLLHAPCGSPSSPDPAYPYANGITGVYGFDVTAGAYGASAVKASSMYDIMGYCSGKWISDYDYGKILAFRASAAADQGSKTTGGAIGDAGAAAGDATAQPCFLIWGHVVNGEPVLEPAFAVTTRPTRPRGRGPFTLRATSASGATLWTR
ncbi:MAG TPA: hypothetical protein VNS52_18335, partial [Gemmatimonadaceae bacterium]|nr:hypothetical protein [Gemmatimonadaceae bacterium]